MHHIVHFRRCITQVYDRIIHPANMIAMLCGNGSLELNAISNSVVLMFQTNQAMSFAGWQLEWNGKQVHRCVADLLYHHAVPLW